jgi:predicted PurR-regulated permease PerM
MAATGDETRNGGTTRDSTSPALPERPVAPGTSRHTAPGDVAAGPATPADSTTAPVPIDIRSATLTIIAALALILMLRHAQPVLIPLVLGALISYGLSPFVSFLARHKVPRAIGAAVAVLLLVGTVGAGAYILRHEVMAIVANVPEAAQRLRHRLDERRGEPGALQQVQQAATEIQKTADQATTSQNAPSGRNVQQVQIVEPTFKASDYLWLGGMGLLGFAGQFAMILFLVYFVLVTGDLYKRKLVKIAGPSLAEKRVTVQILDEINVQIERFIRVQVLTSALVAVATGAVLWWFGLEQFAVWGLLAGIFNSIPYLGPVVVTGGLGVVAFMQFDDLLRAFYICASAFAITSLEGFLLTPTLMGRAARMNPVAVFVGLLFWSWVWGLWGTVLAVPMLMMLKAICDHVEDLQPIGELLGE